MCGMAKRGRPKKQKEPEVSFVRMPGRAAAKDAAAREALAAENPGFTPPTWKQLVGMARLAMEDENEELVKKHEAMAARRQKYMYDNGIGEVADVAALRRGLLEYYCEVATSTSRDVRGAFRRVGANYGDLHGGVLNRCFELWVVREFIVKLRGKIARAVAEESASVAQESQLRLITEDGCELNQRAVEVSLKATMRDVYGESNEVGTVKDGKAGITYNFPNMTLNWIVAPGSAGCAAGNGGIAGAAVAAAGAVPEIAGAAAEAGFDGGGAGASGVVVDAEAVVADAAEPVEAKPAKQKSSGVRRRWNTGPRDAIEQAFGSQWE